MENWFQTNISFTGALSANGQFILEERYNRVRGLSDQSSLSRSESSTRFYLDTHDFLDEAWVNDLRALGLEPYVALLIVRTMSHNGYVHSDGPDTFAALNWAMCDGDHSMEWYSSTENLNDIIAAGNKYGDWLYDASTVTEIDKATFSGDNMTLVRTDTPHDASVNTPGAVRAAVSVRFRNSWNSWEEALQFFKDIKK